MDSSTVDSLSQQLRAENATCKEQVTKLKTQLSDKIRLVSSLLDDKDKLSTEIF